jgi:hypothetical protein
VRLGPLSFTVCLAASIPITSAITVTVRPATAAGGSPGLADAMFSRSMRSRIWPPPGFSSSVSASTNFTMTRSPTLIWSKFLTSGPAWTTKLLPCGPFSVIRRLALSTASTLAVALIASAMETLPGSDFTADMPPVWARAVPAAIDITAAAIRVNLRMLSSCCSVRNRFRAAILLASDNDPT